MEKQPSLSEKSVAVVDPIHREAGAWESWRGRVEGWLEEAEERVEGRRGGRRLERERGRAWSRGGVQERSGKRDSWLRYLL